MAAVRCPSLVLMLLLSCTCWGIASAAEDKNLTYLNLYFRGYKAGTPNPSVVKVASSQQNWSTPAFGDLSVLDAELRDGPDPESRLIGRIQGFGLSSSFDNSAHYSQWIFVFSADSPVYSGSTLIIQGNFDPSGGPSERSIVGGTGKLRFARGYVKSRALENSNTTVVLVFDMYFTLAY